MYSQRNASGGEQSDVHFCTSAHIAALQNCRRRKQPVALNASKATLLLMTNWPMRWWICWWAFGHLGRRSVAWPGFGGCLQPRAPTPHTTTQPPNPPPRDPPVEQSPSSDDHRCCTAPGWGGGNKGRKNFGRSTTWQNAEVAYQASRWANSQSEKF